MVLIGMLEVSAYATCDDDLFATSNYWGHMRKEYQKKAFDAAAVLSTNGHDAVIRDWYCDIPRLPNLDDGVSPMPWLEEKAFLLYYLSTVPPVRASTNCWFAAADALGSCRVLLAQCEADYAQARGEPITTNTTFADLGRLKNQVRTRWNRLVSIRKAEPLLADVVTNKFPSNVGKTLTEEQMSAVQNQAYSRAGLQ